MNCSGVVWFYMVLYGFVWFNIVLHGFVWFDGVSKYQRYGIELKNSIGGWLSSGI